MKNFIVTNGPKEFREYCETLLEYFLATYKKYFSSIKKDEVVDFIQYGQESTFLRPIMNIAPAKGAVVLYNGEERECFFVQKVCALDGDKMRTYPSLEEAAQQEDYTSISEVWI